MPDNKERYVPITSTQFCSEMTMGMKVESQCRFEDMSPTGRLVLYRQYDGDMIVEVIEEDGPSAHIEFTTPMSGGGQSEKTWHALRALMAAMKEDNKRPQQRSMDREKKSFFEIHSETAMALEEAKLWVQSLLTGEPMPNDEWPHLVTCSGDRRFPPGVPGHSCCCTPVGLNHLAAVAERDKQWEAALTRLGERGGWLWKNAEIVISRCKEQFALPRRKANR